MAYHIHKQLPGGNQPRTRRTPGKSGYNPQPLHLLNSGCIGRNEFVEKENKGEYFRAQQVSYLG